MCSAGRRLVAFCGCIIGTCPPLFVLEFPFRVKQSVLVINSGSSSLKFAVFSADCQVIAEGLAERLHNQDALVKITYAGNKTSQAISASSGQAAPAHTEALDCIMAFLRENGLFDAICAVGHRVVHGAEYFSESVLVDDEVISKIEACSRLAPLHNPANILGIALLTKAMPGIPQVAVFDTAFHQTLPEYAYLYALPLSLYKEHGVRRYGFHGTSHRFVSEAAIEALGLAVDQNNIVTVHLGNGCSATAIKNSHSVDTSMGLTPAEGLVMGTRSGDVDPGVLGFLNDALGWSAEEINSVLNRKSGLLGLSELSNDMRTLLEAADAGDTKAATAIDVFCYRLAKYIGGLAVGLGQLDALVFTGGIGENAAVIRSKVLAQLALLNVSVDEQRNANHGRDAAGVISPEGTVPVLVIPTQEERMIAQDTLRLVF